MCKLKIKKLCPVKTLCIILQAGKINLDMSSIIIIMHFIEAMPVVMQQEVVD